MSNNSHPTSIRRDRISDNARINLLEYAERKPILASQPQVVFIELSRRCNLACPNCHRWTLPQASFVDMDDDTFARVLDQLVPTAKLVDLHGLGESTLHTEFARHVRTISALGPRVRVVTNLNGLDDATIDALVEVDAYVCFSLSALGQSEYAKIYAKGDFEQLSTNLRKFQLRRGAGGLSRDMTCLTMVYEPNVDQIHSVMRFVSDFGVRNHRLFPMFLKRGDTRYIGYHMERWERMVAEAFDLADELGTDLRVIDWPEPVKDSQKTLANFVCHRPWTHLHVNVDGQIGLCDYNEHVTDMAGLNIREQEFESIWNGAFYQNLRRQFSNCEPERGNAFCGELCSPAKYVDFDDRILPEIAERVLSNRNRKL